MSDCVGNYDLWPTFSLKKRLLDLGPEANASRKYFSLVLKAVREQMARQESGRAGDLRR